MTLDPSNSRRDQDWRPPTVRRDCGMDYAENNGLYLLLEKLTLTIESMIESMIELRFYYA